MTPILRPFLDEAIESLNVWLNNDRKVIICSELVYECFNNVPQPGYEVEVAGVDPDVVSTGLLQRQNLAPAMTMETADGDFAKSVASFLATFRLRKEDTSASAYVEPRAVPAFVTPRDLATSPNLNLVGQLVPSPALR